MIHPDLKLLVEDTIKQATQIQEKIHNLQYPVNYNYQPDHPNHRRYTPVPAEKIASEVMNESSKAIVLLLNANLAVNMAILKKLDESEAL